MARQFDPKKHSLWQDRFQRFSISDLTVARFCAMEQVSVASFYYWRKKIGGPTVQKTHRPTVHKTHRHPVHKTRRPTVHEHGRQAVQTIGRPPSRVVGSAHHGHASPAFQPVTVVPSVCGVSVRLPGGTQIEIGAAHLDAIHAVVAETVRIDRSWAVCSPSVERNVSSDNPVTHEASHNNQITRNRSSDDNVTRKASPNNQVIRKASYHNQAKRKASSRNRVIRQRSGTVSC